MPYNFCEMMQYKIDYDDLLSTLVGVPQFLANLDYQTHFISDWINALQQLDSIVCKQMSRPDIVHQFIKEVQNEPEVFDQVINIGNNTFHIQFCITALLENIASKDKPMIPSPISSSEFKGGDILWTNTSDCGCPSLDSPIVLVQFPFQQYHWLVIDGNHRLSMHMKHGSDSVQGFFLKGDGLINGKLFASGFDQHLYAMLCELNAAKNLHNKGVADLDILEKSMIYSKDQCFHFSAEDF